MLSFQDFFTACAGFWITERTYHDTSQNQIERSHTEYQVDSLPFSTKQAILAASNSLEPGSGIHVDLDLVKENEANFPGFSISFATVSETGEQVSMSLNALFVPDRYVISAANPLPPSPTPLAAQVSELSAEIIQGFYLRDEGYSESGSIAGRFTYQPTRQTLEMTTHYRRSVAVDQMRLLAPDLRLRTIVTYQRPLQADELPTVITLVGFGVERKQTA